MKNAILPTFVLITGTLVLSWHEINAYQKSSDVQAIQISLLDEDKPDDRNVEQSNQSTPKLSKKQLKKIRRFVKEHTSLQSLRSSEIYMSYSDSQKKEADQLLLKRLVKKSPAEAINAGKALISESPNNASLQFKLALAYRRSGNIDGAIKTYQDLIFKFPDHQSATINLGLLFKKRQQWMKAENTLNRAVEISNGKKKAKALSVLSSIYRKQGRLQHALDNLKKSIQYRPDHSSTWLSLAEVMKDLNYNYSEIVTTYERAIRLSPSEYKLVRKLAYFQLESLEFHSAQKTFSKALVLSPFDIASHRGLAWAYLEAGYYGKAEKKWHWLEKNEKTAEYKTFASFAQKVVAHINSPDQQSNVMPFDFQAASGQLSNYYEHLQLALFEAQSNEKPPVRNPCRAVLDQLETRSNRLLYKATKCELNQRNSENAEQILAVLSQKMSNSSEIHFLMGLTYSQQGKYALAEEQYLLASSLSPERRDIKVGRVKNQIAMNELEQAEQLLNQSLLQDPDQVELLDLSAEVAWQKQDWATATSLYEKLTHWRAQQPQYWYRLAYANSHSDKTDLAKENLFELLNLDAEHIEGRLLLAKLHCQSGEKGRCKTEAARVLKLDKNNLIAERLIQN